MILTDGQYIWPRHPADEQKWPSLRSLELNWPWILGFRTEVPCPVLSLMFRVALQAFSGAKRMQKARVLRRSPLWDKNYYVIPTLDNRYYISNSACFTFIDNHNHCTGYSSNFPGVMNCQPFQLAGVRCACDQIRVKKMCATTARENGR